MKKFKCITLTICIALLSTSIIYALPMSNGAITSSGINSIDNLKGDMALLKAYYAQNNKVYRCDFGFNPYDNVLTTYIWDDDLVIASYKDMCSDASKEYCNTTILRNHATSVRCKYQNQGVVDFVGNNSDPKKPYVMIYFDDGSFIKETNVFGSSKNELFYVGENYIQKSKPLQSITKNNEKLVPIRTKYAKDDVTDIVFNSSDPKKPYVIVYFDDGSFIKECDVIIIDGICYTTDKVINKEFIPSPIVVDNKNYIPARIKYANKGIIDFEYGHDDNNNPILILHQDGYHNTIHTMHDCIIKNDIAYVKA